MVFPEVIAVAGRLACTASTGRHVQYSGVEDVAVEAAAVCCCLLLLLLGLGVGGGAAAVCCCRCCCRRCRCRCCCRVCCIAHAPRQLQRIKPASESIRAFGWLHATRCCSNVVWLTFLSLRNQLPKSSSRLRACLQHNSQLQLNSTQHGATQDGIHAGRHLCRGARQYGFSGSVVQCGYGVVPLTKVSDYHDQGTPLSI